MRRDGTVHEAGGETILSHPGTGPRNRKLSTLAPKLLLASHQRHEARQAVLLPFAGTMARTMRLFLIRHGETVDNVAGL